MAVAKLVRNSRTADEWAKLISASWTKTLESVFETGDALIGAKDSLKHGEWLKLINNNELPFGKRTADRLVAIASDERLRNGTHASHLPSSWMTLYEIHRLEDERLEQSFEKESIHPKMERKDVKFLPSLPYYEPKVKKKKQKVAEETIETADDCITHVRRVVFEFIGTLTLPDRAALFAELHAELDDLEIKNGEQ
jgi:hypothetical protein